MVKPANSHHLYSYTTIDFINGKTIMVDQTLLQNQSDAPTDTNYSRGDATTAAVKVQSWSTANHDDGVNPNRR